MNKRFWTCVLFLVVGVIVVVIWHRPAHQIATPESTQEAIQHANVSGDATIVKAQNIPGDQVSTATPSANPSPAESDRERLPELFQKYNEQHNAPIEFYGQVLDQESNPVPDVTIDVAISQTYMESPTNLAFIPKTFHLEKETGADGRFEITGETGDGFDIESIKKTDYELSPRTSLTFTPTVGNFENPTIFKMWKTGEKAQLVSGSKFWGIIPDGRIYTIDLLQGTKVESANAVGDLRLAVSRPAGVSRQDHYDWSFQIIPIDGGIIETEDDFMYEAPANGYAPKYDFHLNTTDTNWAYRVKKDFFIKTRAGNNYGRINVEVFAHYQNAGVFNVGWTVNPNGSQNLQP